MELGETIATYDVDLALRGESGKFEVTSPANETYFVTRKPNQSISKPELAADRAYPQAFLVRKIAESISQGEPSSRAPFLLENREDLGELPANADLAIATPTATQETPGEAPQVWNLDLSYSESDAGMEQPSASICVKSAREDYPDTPGKPLTSPCGTFNELEAEIRKLHAQLDEICLRAKKKFYKAQAASA